MSQIAYQILEVGWQYNDEFYRDENTFEKPKLAFLDKEKAEAEKLKLEIKSYRGNELELYTSGGFQNILERKVTFEELAKYMKDTFNTVIHEDDYYSGWTVPETATDEEVYGLIKLLNLRFYELVEIKIEE